MKQDSVIRRGATLAVAGFACLQFLYADEPISAQDYVQEGLVAHWDAKNFSGPGIPANSNWAYWRDLVNGRVLYMRGDAYTPELGVHRAAGASYYGVQVGGNDDFLMPSEDGVTVEIAVTMGAYTYTPLLVGSRKTGVAIGYNYPSPSGWILNNDALEDTRMAYKPTINRSWDKMPEFWVITACYTNGHICLENTYLNGASPTPVTTAFLKPTACQSGERLRVMADYSSESWSAFRIHAIRVYNRKLTADEATANRELDTKRYCREDYYVENRLFYSFKVKSGAVTVADKTYGPGDFVYYRNDQPVPVEADDAVVVPRADGLSEISLVSGSLTIQVEDGGAMAYVKSLTVGADATLNVPAQGLDAAVLTAETGASVSGSGLLVSAAASCPITGYANYLSANYSWTDWPANGVAYVPVGANLAVTAAQAAALDGIVFLDDGTAAAKSSKVSYTGSDALILKAELAGPGIFSAANAGKLTVTGDSRHFSGNFFIDNTETLVANEYGLGSGESRPAEVKLGEAGGIRFDNGAAAFIFRAPLRIGSTTTASEVLQSESTETELVFAEDVERVNYNNVVGGMMKFYGHVTFKKWYKTSGTNYAPLLDDANGSLEFAGPVNAGQLDFYMATHKGPVTYSCMIANAQLIAPPSLAFGSNYAAVYASSLAAIGTKFQLFNDQTYTLNGCDQDFAYLYVYNNTAKGTFVSDTPAQVRVIGSSSQTISPIFTGAAGFTHAAADAVTTKLSGDRVSDTTGLLKVDSGTLELCNGYQWLGTNVVVAGGALVVSDTASFGRKTVLSVNDADGARMTLPTDAALSVRAFKRNGTWVEKGLYGGAAALAAGKIGAAHCLDCFGETSTGVLNVLRDSDEPTGLMVIFR